MKLQKISTIQTDWDKAFKTMEVTANEVEKAGETLN